MLGVGRDAERVQALAAEIGGRAGSPADIAEFADVVVLATPWNAVAEAVATAGPFAGKVLIDCTNYFDNSGGPSGAEQIAGMAEGARVVKAFNTVFASLYPELPTRIRPNMVYCGDDAEAKQLAATLIQDAGFEPLDVGPLASAREIEAFARLVIGLAYRQGKGPFFYRMSQPAELNGGL